MPSCNYIYGMPRTAGGNAGHFVKFIVGKQAKKYDWQHFDFFFSPKNAKCIFCKYNTT